MPISIPWLPHIAQLHMAWMHLEKAYSNLDTRTLKQISIVQSLLCLTLSFFNDTHRDTTISQLSKLPTATVLTMSSEKSWSNGKAWMSGVPYGKTPSSGDAFYVRLYTWNLLPRLKCTMLHIVAYPLHIHCISSRVVCTIVLGHPSNLKYYCSSTVR